MLDRRELLYRASLILGGAISASAASGILAGCTATPEPMGPATATGFLTQAELADITAMADHIVPRTDTPGAVDVGVPLFIDRMLAGYYPDRERQIMRAGLATVAADAAKLRGRPFVQLAPAERITLMERYDREQYDYTRANTTTQNLPPHFFRLIKELTITGYCTSEAGATALMNYQQTPGPYRGDVPLAEIGRVSAL